MKKLTLIGMTLFVATIMSACGTSRNDSSTTWDTKATAPSVKQQLCEKNGRTRDSETQSCVSWDESTK